MPLELPNLPTTTYPLSQDNSTQPNQLISASNISPFLQEIIKQEVDKSKEQEKTREAFTKMMRQLQSNIKSSNEEKTQLAKEISLLKTENTNLKNANKAEKESLQSIIKTHAETIQKKDDEIQRLISAMKKIYDQTIQLDFPSKIIKSGEPIEIVGHMSSRTGCSNRGVFINSYANPYQPNVELKLRPICNLLDDIEKTLH